MVSGSSPPLATAASELTFTINGRRWCCHDHHAVWEVSRAFISKLPLEYLDWLLNQDFVGEPLVQPFRENLTAGYLRRNGTTRKLI